MTTVQLSTTGDDANDGVNGPVKTLKRAIAIATSNGKITKIAVAAGKYGVANGDTYPYTVPANVTIQGAAGGGSILAGTAAEDGLSLDTGALQDLELEDFTFAIKARGTSSLQNVKVRTSQVAVSVETAGKLTATKLGVTGVAGKCTNVGLQTSGSGQLTVTELTVQSYGVALNQTGQSTVSITTGTVTGDPVCAQTLFSVSGASLTLVGTTIDGGNSGINFTGSTTATLTNTTIANTKGDAISGRVATFQMMGGELRNNGRGGLEAFLGSWTFTNVGIKGNPVFGIYIQGSSVAQLGTVTLRGSTVSGNGIGIYVFGFGVVDLGTAANPGNNTFQGNANVGLQLDGGSNGARKIDAAGNTWRINTQGANAQGKYGAALNSGPVAPVDGNNFSINSGWSIQF